MCAYVLYVWVIILQICFFTLRNTKQIDEKTQYQRHTTYALSFSFPFLHIFVILFALWCMVRNKWDLSNQQQAEIRRWGSHKSWCVFSKIIEIDIVAQFAVGRLLLMSLRISLKPLIWIYIVGLLVCRYLGSCYRFTFR